MALPSTYKQVEYIQSSGTQRIDTLFTPTNNTKVEISMGGWSDNGSYPAMFGCYDTWSTTSSVAKGIFLNRNVGSNGYGYMFGGAYNGVTFSFANGQNHTYSVSQSGVIQDGTLLYTPTTVTFTGVKPISIFSLNTQANGITDYSIFKLYYCKIYESGTLVRDLVPVIRKSDNKPGLYDLVNNVFYTNAGTGEFTYQEFPTQGKIKKIYIGSQQVRPKNYRVSYYPLTSTTTVNDMSGNGYNLTKYGNATFGTYQGVSCLYLPGDSSSYLTCAGDSNTYSDFTISIWFYLISNSKTQNLIWFGSPGIFINTSNQPRFAGANGIPTTPTITNAWKNIVCTASGTTAKIYVNGVAYSGTWQTQYSLGTNVSINQPIDSSHDSKGYLSNVITESRVWTAQEVSDYFNANKSNYGL